MPLCLLLVDEQIVLLPKSPDWLSQRCCFGLVGIHNQTNRAMFDSAARDSSCKCLAYGCLCI